MVCFTRAVLRLFVLTMALGATCSPGLTPPPAATNPTVAGALPEVRLRKLHLVRPDLILYPLAVEIVC